MCDFCTSSTDLFEADTFLSWHVKTQFSSIKPVRVVFEGVAAGPLLLTASLYTLTSCSPLTVVQTIQSRMCRWRPTTVCCDRASTMTQQWGTHFTIKASFHAIALTHIHTGHASLAPVISQTRLKQSNVQDGDYWHIVRLKVTLAPANYYFLHQEFCLLFTGL